MANYTNQIVVYQDGKIKRIKSTDNLEIGGKFTAGTAEFGGDVRVGGNLNVTGDIIAASSQSVIIGDNFLDLNAAYTDGNQKAGGLAVNSYAASAPFPIVQFYPGVAGVSDPYFTLPYDPMPVFAAGQIIQISGSTDSKNDGQYIIQNVLGDPDNTIVVQGIGLNTPFPWVPFAHNQFVAQAGDSAVATRIVVSALASSNEQLYSLEGALIPSGNWAQAVGTVAADFDGTVNDGVHGWKPLRASLQTAYRTGNTITVSNTYGDLTVNYESGTEAGYNFTASKDSYIKTEEDKSLWLGGMNGVVRMAGPTMLAGGGFTNTNGSNGNALADYTFVYNDAVSGNLAAATSAVECFPVGVIRTGNFLASVAGTSVRVLGKTDETWVMGDRLYMSSTAGYVSKNPPASGRVFLAGIAEDIFDGSVDAYANMRLQLQYIADI